METRKDAKECVLLHESDSGDDDSKLLAQVCAQADSQTRLETRKMYGLTYLKPEDLYLPGGVKVLETDGETILEYSGTGEPPVIRCRDPRDVGIYVRRWNVPVKTPEQKKEKLARDLPDLDRDLDEKLPKIVDRVADWYYTGDTLLLLAKREDSGEIIASFSDPAFPPDDIEVVKGDHPYAKLFGLDRIPSEYCIIVLWWD